MRTIKILALSALLVAATAAVSFAGEGCTSQAKAKAETAQASANCSGAETAQASASCMGAETAHAPGAACCADAATAGAKTAGAGCSEGAKSAMEVRLETVRMPSGALAVFYHGENAGTVTALQASAAGGCSEFSCQLAKSVAADENCTVEMAKTETGVMMLVTAEKTAVVDKHEAEYVAAIASMSASSETESE